MLLLIQYADGILNSMDKENKIFQHRLYRQHTSISNMGFVKDLSKIGRDLNKVVMIDNIVENFRLQPNNGLWTTTWTEDIKETQLQDMCRILLEIYSYKPNDIRLYIKKIKDEVSIKLNKNIQNPYFKLETKPL